MHKIFKHPIMWFLTSLSIILKHHLFKIVIKQPRAAASQQLLAENGVETFADFGQIRKSLSREKFWSPRSAFNCL